ncbi:MAG: hypothetical protein B9S32_02585 [Verrucomicrobia bacterium Tous-C9LFEB]|nr:MAG: hypothetical protein B9S32_02585 [Verrucomicrobia bacterium Tous-C9LFEB]
MKPLRPTSVSVVSWLLIASAVAQFILIDLARQNGKATLLAQTSLPVSTQYLVLFTSLGVTVLCGALLINGINLARFVYLAQGLALHGTILTSTSQPVLDLPGLIGFAIALFFLFRPQANAYFRGEPTVEDLRGRYWQGH